MKHLCVFTVLLLMTPGPVSAADAKDQEVSARLAEMNTTLKDIARLLREGAALQKSDLLMKRVTLASTQFAAAQEHAKRVDQELRTAKSDESEFEGLLGRLQSERSASDDARNAQQSQMRDIKTHLSAIRDRLSALNQEKIETDNDLERLRSDTREWQKLLDRSLTASP
jgi:chromosome segregation ATPase